MAQASMVEAQASASSSSFWALGMDVQIPPVFYRTLSPFGAKVLLTSKTTADKSPSRARVPETISCLWATSCTIICNLQSSAISLSPVLKPQLQKAWYLD